VNEYNSFLIDIGNRIYDRRKQLGITQEYLSELCDTTPQAISNYERGEREMKASSIIKMSNALNISTDYLLTGIDTSLDSLCEDLSEKDIAILKDIINKCIDLTK
jgi:transcriptional regulator with XRE-family HTH domain